MSANPLEAALKASLASLEQAKLAVETAEMQLETVLSDLRVAPRAEKTSISTALESALATLRLARTRVVEVETTLAAKIQT